MVTYKKTTNLVYACEIVTCYHFTLYFLFKTNIIIVVLKIMKKIKKLSNFLVS